MPHDSARTQFVSDTDGDDQPVREDDFYCLRYSVWYPSLDCAYRTKFRTAPGCLNCDQGRFNLKRHADAFRRDPLAVLTRRGCR